MLSPHMWNLNYQGLKYGVERIRTNMTMIFSQVGTAGQSLINLPQTDFDELIKIWNKIDTFRTYANDYYYFNDSCEETIPLLKNLTIVITRDKYDIPP